MAYNAVGSFGKNTEKHLLKMCLGLGVSRCTISVLLDHKQASIVDGVFHIIDCLNSYIMQTTLKT